MGPSREFWRGRRVLVTGHTGFKGSWLCRTLHALGAEVTGLSLDPLPGPNGFEVMRAAEVLTADHRADMRDAGAVAALVRGARPEILIHMAAQAFVSRGYREPALTFATNAMGTVNLLEAVRRLDGLQAALIVTSDKVYRNDSAGRAFAEGDALGGEDPYSASKAAAEIAVTSYRHSFAAELPPVATARAGNVIGGGDWAEFRIIPDLVRSQVAGETLMLRRPDATRPFQHVIDVLRGYLMLAERLATSPGTAPASLNFGPRDGEVRVRDLLAQWQDATGEPVRWEQVQGPVMDEARRLALDSSLATRALGWEPVLDTRAAIAATASWYAAWRRGEDMAAVTDREIADALGARAVA
jgi:CDP-glucose 4,6-dehydratase